MSKMYGTTKRTPQQREMSILELESELLMKRKPMGPKAAPMPKKPSRRPPRIA